MPIFSANFCVIVLISTLLEINQSKQNKSIENELLVSEPPIFGKTFETDTRCTDMDGDTQDIGRDGKLNQKS